MTDVYKQRREELEKHYLKEEAKVCTFTPANLTAPRGKALFEASKLTRNTAPASSEALHSRSMSVVRDAEERETMRGVREVSRLFQGLEEGAWLQGNATDSATTEAALGELHSSIFCLERSERSLTNSLLLHSSAAEGRAEAGGRRGGQSLPQSRDSQRPPSVSANALQLSAEFAALLSSSQNLASRDQERASRARAPATPAAAAVASSASVSFRDDLIRASRQMTDAHPHAQAAGAHLSIYAKVMFVHTHTHV